MQTIRQIKLLANRAKHQVKRWRPIGNRLTILSDDRFIVGYPKSGNTWLRFLVAQFQVQGPLDFHGIEKVVPDIYKHSDRELLRVVRPRLLFSHEPFSPTYSRVIYMVRDPRDVAISMYYWLCKTGSFHRRDRYKHIADGSLRNYLRFFATQETFFHGWGAHVTSWTNDSGYLGTDRMMVLRYEDIKQSPIKNLRRVVEFLKIPISQNDLNTQLHLAVELSTADRMRGQEVTLPGWLLRAMGRERIPFVREARARQWKPVFDEELNALYWDKFSRHMERLGYARD